MPQLLADISFSDSIQQTFDEFFAFIPRLIGAIIIFMIGWFIARVIRKIIHRILTRLNIDTLVDKSGLGSYIERAGYPDSGLLLAQIVYIGIMLLVLMLTVGALGIDSIEQLVEDFVNFIPKLFVAIIIVFITGAIANWVRGALARTTNEFAWGNLVTSLAVIGVWLIGVFAALDQVEIAQNIVQLLFQALIGSLAAILIIQFGVGGIWAARDRFWPAVYDRFSEDTRDKSGETPPMTE